MVSSDSAYGSEDGGEASRSPERASAVANGSLVPGAMARSAVAFALQSQKLSHRNPKSDGREARAVAVEAAFITPHDPVVVTSEGQRLPSVPLQEAHRLNMLRDELEESPPGLDLEPDERTAADRKAEKLGMREERRDSARAAPRTERALERSQEGSLRKQMPPFHTNPLFPPLPLYGPPTLMRELQCVLFRASSFLLSLAFLGVIVLGALFTSVPTQARRVWLSLTGQNPDARRPFYEEELRRREARQEQAGAWKRRRSQERLSGDKEGTAQDGGSYVPTEGGPDPIRCDVGYYARRVGLDVEAFEVQTEDGFIIDLWHVFDPEEHARLPEGERKHRGPDLFTGETRAAREAPGRGRRFPVLLMHGLLQSAGAYCVNDDDSLAFYLCKSGYDVWLGNNRCGFRPRHVLLDYADPRMWCWNIRQMGVFDLPALTSRVLYETGFGKIGLICHSQGTTQTLVALAKEQRPELGERLTVFCALAPAAYAGPLIGKMYFKFMRVITPAMFRLMFGIHAFIPFMMDMHALLPPRLYGFLGYKVFSFLFNWSDARWDRGLRDRMFQFAPVYVSSESMRWWLGRECFARQKCILATKEEWRAEEREDNEAAQRGVTPGERRASAERAERETEAQARRTGEPAGAPDKGAAAAHRRKPRGSTAWYNEQAPPFALWVAGNDDLVDGRRLLRRFERGREPHVRLVHAKVIPGFEHLDVIWAMDAVDQVFKEVREVLWKTCDARDRCRVPRGCEEVEPWQAEPARRDKQEGGGQQQQQQQQQQQEEGDDDDQSPSSSSGE